ncbi:hypothetical protein CDD81_3817 [Ophiocordyceps australis]|uniref:Uncharacterized protein n=1 Tax=Ophiocordyceps australis TaxID=1399860 RepID=A0A2C5XDX9_9HYPO|nr:hypothetical protein CDD81_3817 [Ophiocordyceps australis]
MPADDASPGSLQPSPPVSSSPSSPPRRPVCDRAATPLGLFVNKAKDPADDPFAAMSPARTPEAAVSLSLPSSSPRLAHGDAQKQGHGLIGPSVEESDASRRYQLGDNQQPLFALGDCQPLRTASVRADTCFAHPRPSVSELGPGSSVSSIAQLEATAERLSMTSIIDDAIRDLHDTLKRSDSRREQRVAASLRADSNGDADDDQLRRYLSSSSSIISTNAAARGGGYSPAAFVMSPNHSLSGRFGGASKLAVADADRMRPVAGLGDATPTHLEDIVEAQPAFIPAHAPQRSSATLPMGPHVMLDTCTLPSHHGQVEASKANVLHHMPGKASENDASPPAAPNKQATDYEQRPLSSHSNTAIHQYENAFIDFDGVHCQPDADQDDHFGQLETAPEVANARPTSLRPQSYIDPQTGQRMLYYPARVPALLNLPPKLVNKPKLAQRNDRRSQILSVMMESRGDLSGVVPQPSWMKVPAAANTTEAASNSWLPDTLASHRDSFAALSLCDVLNQSDTPPDAREEPPLEKTEAVAEPAPTQLRRPQSLSAANMLNRKSKASLLSHLPPQLRASVFFDLPSIAPEVQPKKEGSAMATLDSILDASTTAPVSVFTDHAMASELRSEAYGNKTNKARKSTASLNTPSPPPAAGKRLSLMWLGKRRSGNLDEKKRSQSMASAPLLTNGDAGHKEAVAGDATNAGSDDDGALGAKQPRSGEEEPGEEEEAQEEEETEEEEQAYQGPPTTLLAELQLRKHQQQQRKKNFVSGFPNGMHATLLEMDTVAEAQRLKRRTQRVNLAWEEPDAHVDQNGVDDEDVPLAILAAIHHGAKNRADLERPMGLMERRDIEDNEPLSHRRARLQGLEPPPPRVIQKHQSVLSLSALRAKQSKSPLCAAAINSDEAPQEATDKSKSLEKEQQRSTSETSDEPLPLARPVSSSFSAELLSQFELDQSKSKASGQQEEAKPRPQRQPQHDQGGEEETLGQRRRRLQAERAAREREMSHGNRAGESQRVGRRLSMADILAAHPKKDLGLGVEQEGRRLDESRRLAQEQEAKMAAMRSMMPQSLAVPNVARSGGFMGGAYNDGSGGHASRASRSSPSVNTQGLSYGNKMNRSSVGVGGYGTPAYAAAGAYKGGTAFQNGNAVPAMYGGLMMAPGMQMSLPTGSMDRVEQWRRGVHP